MVYILLQGPWQQILYLMVVLMIMYLYLYLNKQGPQVFPNIYDRICSYFQTLDKHHFIQRYI